MPTEALLSVLRRRNFWSGFGISKGRIAEAKSTITSSCDPKGLASYAKGWLPIPMSYLHSQGLFILYEYERLAPYACGLFAPAEPLHSVLGCRNFGNLLVYSEI